jgi:colanic acid biosynthesis glycosyl transferase WcaI
VRIPRPTIFIGDQDGEIARVIRRHECGLTVATGDGPELAETIIDLAAEPALCRRTGERARQAFEVEFDKPIAIGRWEEVLREVEGLRAALPLDAQRTSSQKAQSLSSRNAR